MATRSRLRRLSLLAVCAAAGDGCDEERLSVAKNLKEARTDDADVTRYCSP